MLGCLCPADGVCSGSCAESSSLENDVWGQTPPAMVLRRPAHGAVPCQELQDLRHWLELMSDFSACFAAKTHRELFSEFYRDLLKEPLEDVLAICPRPLASLQLFQRMMHDIMTGGQTSDPIDQVNSFLSCERACAREM